MPTRRRKPAVISPEYSIRRTAEYGCDIAWLGSSAPAPSFGVLSASDGGLGLRMWLAGHVLRLMSPS
jgi:hypothetical protein